MWANVGSSNMFKAMAKITTPKCKCCINGYHLNKQTIYLCNRVDCITFDKYYSCEESQKYYFCFDAEEKFLNPLKNWTLSCAQWKSIDQNNWLKYLRHSLPSATEPRSKQSVYLIKSVVLTECQQLDVGRSAMAIKPFSTVEKLYGIIGICLPSQSNRRCSMFNIRSTFILFSLTQMCLTSTAFILFRAKSVFEYGFPTYVSITLASCAVYFSIQFRKIEDILQFIKTCNEFIEKSKCRLSNFCLQCHSHHSHSNYRFSPCWIC